MRGGNTVLRKKSLLASSAMARSQNSAKAAEPISQDQRLAGDVTAARMPAAKPSQCNVELSVWMMVWNRMSAMSRSFSFCLPLWYVCVPSASAYGTMAYQRKGYCSDHEDGANHGTAGGAAGRRHPGARPHHRRGVPAVFRARVRRH